MLYKLYTLVDITNTGQTRPEPGKEQDHWKEQNFQTVLQALGMRANVRITDRPQMLDVGGHVVGFDNFKGQLIRVWRLDFATDRDDVYEINGDPVEGLREDFEMVPYISGLDEGLKTRYDAFLTYGDVKNIVFFKK